MNKKINNINILVKAQCLSKRLCCVLAMLLMCVLAMQAAFTYQNSTYTVNADGSTVTLTKGNMTYGTTIIVPNYAYDDGDKAYAVTIVAANAFTNPSRQATKVVIGDYVTSIGRKAFERFGEQTNGNVLILGKSVKNIDDKAFEHFGENGTGNKVFITSDDMPTVFKQTLEHVRNTTFYVRDEATYNEYLHDKEWGKFENNKNNHYKYPFPSEMNINGNKWVTAIFPEALDRTAIESWFGKDTKWALWTNQSYHVTGNQYEFVLEFYNQGTKTIPANTPVLIKPSNKESHYLSDIEYADGEQSITQEYRVADPHELSMIGATEDDYTLKKGEFYIRSYEGDKLTFFEAEDDNKCHVKKGKCWFRLTELATGNIASAKLMFSIDGVHTAIDRVETDLEHKPTRIYSVTGQYEGSDISKLSKGVHIVNGKKILVK